MHSSSSHKKLTYQSIPSLTTPANSRGIFWKGEFPTPWAQVESAKPRTLGQKNGAKVPPPGQLFSKIQPKKTTKHETELKADLHIVATIAEHVCDHVLERILKLSADQLQIFLVKYEYLRWWQLCEDQDIRANLKKHVCNHVLAILTTYMDTMLKKNSTEMLIIMFINIKPVKYTEARSFLVGGFYRYSKYLKSFIIHL